MTTLLSFFFVELRLILKRYYYSISIALLILQSFILENFLGKIAPENIFSFIISGAIYLTIFKSLITLFEWKGWKYFMQPSSLEGKWFITFSGVYTENVIDKMGKKKEKRKKYTRYGHIYVTWDTPIDIQITGANYTDKGKESTTWEGVVIYLKNHELKYTYIVKRLGQGKHNKEGVYIGTINKDEKNNIVTIKGGYKDDTENNHGVTTWSRIAPIGHPDYIESIIK